jgi:hypothetical protein
MGDVVNFDRSKELESDHEFLIDMARFSEGLADEKTIRKKYRFDATTWEKLGENDRLVELIEDEKIRRIRTGAAKREKAQTLIVQAPDILNNIMMNADSPKHKIDAIKTLDSFTGTPGEGAPVADRFVIQIVLNADNPAVEHTEVYSKSFEINPDDIDPFAPPAEVVATIAAKKTDEGGNGNAI